MKDYYLYLAALTMTLLIIAGLALINPVPESTPVVHPEFKTMLHSANSQASSPAIKYLGYAFGLSILAIFGMSLYWGSKRAKDSGFRIRNIMIGMGLYALTYTGMVLSSWEYDQVEAPIWGGLPIPTAWMLYGIWFVPVFLIVLYVKGFNKHVLSAEDEARFHRIVEKRNAAK